MGGGDERTKKKGSGGGGIKEDRVKMKMMMERSRAAQTHVFSCLTSAVAAEMTRTFIRMCGRRAGPEWPRPRGQTLQVKQVQTCDRKRVQGGMVSEELSRFPGQTSSTELCSLDSPEGLRKWTFIQWNSEKLKEMIFTERSTSEGVCVHVCVHETAPGWITQTLNQLMKLFCEGGEVDAPY